MATMSSITKLGSFTKIQNGIQLMATSKKTKRSTTKTSEPRDTLKKLFFAGLGLMDETSKILHQNFNDLVKKGKAREPEIKKAVEDIQKKASTRRKELEKKFTNLIKDNELVKSKEFQALLKRLETLEA
jgi:polyhydroxyalkanoate synthesis regulator phasin